MANLKEIAELTWRQLFPEPSKPPISKEEFLATARTEYAGQMWIMSKNEKNQEGVFNLPSILLSESPELPVDKATKSIDISDLEIMRGLTNDSWLQNIGGLTCSCIYVKSNLNQSQLLCDDDSLPDSAKTYYVQGNQIFFPRGTHAEKIKIIYANKGLPVEGRIEVDDVIGSIIRTRLLETYGGKMGKEDVTNNSNPNN